MAETRNIKDLPQTDAMTAGDYFLIEAPAGTQLIAFENFVIDEDNTTFATDLKTNMTTLSTQVTAVSADLDLSGANAAAKLYLVNTQLGERIDAMQEVLYGSDFESQINEFIGNRCNHFFAISDLSGALVGHRVIRIPVDVCTGTQRPGAYVQHEGSSVCQRPEALLDRTLQLVRVLDDRARDVVGGSKLRKIDVRVT